MFTSTANVPLFSRAAVVLITLLGSSLVSPTPAQAQRSGTYNGDWQRITFWDVPLLAPNRRIPPVIHARLGITTHYSGHHAYLRPYV